MMPLHSSRDSNGNAPLSREASSELFNSNGNRPTNREPSSEMGGIGSCGIGSRDSTGRRPMSREPSWEIGTDSQWTMSREPSREMGVVGDTNGMSFWADSDDDDDDDDSGEESESSSTDCDDDAAASNALFSSHSRSTQDAGLVNTSTPSSMSMSLLQQLLPVPALSVTQTPLEAFVVASQPVTTSTLTESKLLSKAIALLQVRSATPCDAISCCFCLCLCFVVKST
jgi:hypothetical protein